MSHLRQSLTVTRWEMEKRRDDLFRRGDLGAMCWLLRIQAVQPQGASVEKPAANMIERGDGKWQDSGW